MASSISPLRITSHSSNHIEIMKKEKEKKTKSSLICLQISCFLLLSQSDNYLLHQYVLRLYTIDIKINVEYNIVNYRTRIKSFCRFIPGD